MYKFAFLSTVFSAIFLWYFFNNSSYLQKLVVIVESNSKIPLSLLKNQFQAHLESKFLRSKLFTPEQLKYYDGRDDSRDIYVSILGDVYDVTKKRKHYGPNGPYHSFAGTDASRSFVTGEFIGNKPRDDVLDLSSNELLGLRDWVNFYKREYECKGKLIGRYYDSEGKRTKYWEEIQELIIEADKDIKAELEDEILYPPCNVEWHPDTGTKVWCSNRSGGVERSWVGVPRKLYVTGSESYRCACVNVDEMLKLDFPQHIRRGHLLQYENCDPFNHVCFIN